MKILTLDKPIIRKKLKPVGKIDKNVREIIEKMRATVVAEKDPEGVGLAANQVGIDMRLYLAKTVHTKHKKGQAIKPPTDKMRGQQFEAFINPEIIAREKETHEAFEGCLSIPDIYGFVKRPKAVTVKYTTSQGKVVTKHFLGLPARIMQHELDHLNGMLFIDHVAVQTKELFQFTGTDDKGEPVFEKIRMQ